MYRANFNINRKYVHVFVAIMGHFPQKILNLAFQSIISYFQKLSIFCLVQAGVSNMQSHLQIRLWYGNQSIEFIVSFNETMKWKCCKLIEQRRLKGKSHCIHQHIENRMNSTRWAPKAIYTVKRAKEYSSLTNFVHSAK